MTSVLKWDFKPLMTKTDDVVTRLGSRIVSINMFDSNKNVVAYTTRKVFNLSFSLLQVRVDIGLIRHK